MEDELSCVQNEEATEVPRRNVMRHFGASSVADVGMGSGWGGLENLADYLLDLLNATPHRLANTPDLESKTRRHHHDSDDDGEGTEAHEDAFRRVMPEVDDECSYQGDSSAVACHEFSSLQSSLTRREGYNYILSSIDKIVNVSYTSTDEKTASNYPVSRNVHGRV